MGNFARRILWLIFSIALVYGGYRAYMTWWDTGAVQYLKAKVQDVVQDSGEKAKQTVSDQAGEYAHSVVGEAEGATRRYVADKTADALAYIGEKILSAASSLGGSESIFSGVALSGGTSVSQEMPSDPVFIVPPPPATITTHPGTPLVFSIDRAAAYTVDWGDGNRGSGTVHDGEVLLLSHIWEAEGDFQVRITFDGPEGVSTSFFPVRVYAR